MSEIRLPKSVCSKPGCNGVLIRKVKKPNSLNEVSVSDKEYVKTWKLRIRHMCSVCGLQHIPDKEGNVGQKVSI